MNWKILGKWKLSFILDIDECKNVSFIDDVGSGDVRNENRIPIGDNENNAEEESDVCGMNAKCVNTPGSYKCICNKDYQMRDGKCIWAPGGGNIIPTLPSHKPSMPKPQDYTWLEILVGISIGWKICSQFFLKVALEKVSENCLLNKHRGILS